MADLDDFFAKKDKKKKSKGKKFTSKTPTTLSEPTVKPLEDDSAKDVKIDDIPAQSKDEEWLEQTEVVEDLEGIKVTPLGQEESEEASKSSQPADDNGDQDGENSADASNKPTSKQAVSPWQQATADDDEDSEDEEDQTPAILVNRVDELTSQGTYVPPYLRRGQGMPPPSGSSRRFKSKAPPDIQNAMAFPSLQASATTPKSQ